MPRVRYHRRGKQNPPASVAQTETPHSSSRPENSPGIRSEIVPLPLAAPSRPPRVAGRKATVHHMGLPGTTGYASDTRWVMALGTSQRNIAASLVAASQSFSDPKVVVM